MLYESQPEAEVPLSTLKGASVSSCILGMSEARFLCRPSSFGRKYALQEKLCCPSGFLQLQLARIRRAFVTVVINDDLHILVTHKMASTRLNTRNNSLSRHEKSGDPPVSALVTTGAESPALLETILFGGYNATSLFLFLQIVLPRKWPFLQTHAWPSSAPCCVVG